MKKCLEEREHNVPASLIGTPISIFLWLRRDNHCSNLGLLNAHCSTQAFLHMALPPSSLTCQPSEGKQWLWLDPTTTSHASQQAAARQNGYGCFPYFSP